MGGRESMEVLTWYFAQVGNNTTTLYMQWGENIFPLHIEVEMELQPRPTS